MNLTPTSAAHQEVVWKLHPTHTQKNTVPIIFQTQEEASSEAHHENGRIPPLLTMASTFRWCNRLSDV